MSESPSAAQRIWVVDDDRAVRFVLCNRAARGGLPGRRFRQRRPRPAGVARGPPPALLFTDVRMPGDDGLVLLDKLKAALPQLPVVVMSAYTDVASTAGAFRGGAHEFLSAVRSGRCGGTGAAGAAGRGTHPGRAQRGSRNRQRPAAATGGRYPGDARAVPCHWSPGAGAAGGADHRRDRHRQGTGGPCAASRIAACARAVRCAQHRRDSCRAAGKRVVRP